MYFEREATCYTNVEYKIIQGDTQITEEGCNFLDNTLPPLYPAVVGPLTYVDNVRPTITVNGNASPYTIYARADAYDVAKVVNFNIVATDNCDPSPTVTVSHPSGSAFPVGRTSVTINARDDDNNTRGFTLYIDVEQAPTQVSLLRSSLLLHGLFCHCFSYTQVLYVILSVLSKWK